MHSRLSFAKRRIFSQEGVAAQKLNNIRLGDWCIWSARVCQWFNGWEWHVRNSKTGLSAWKLPIEAAKQICTTSCLNWKWTARCSWSCSAKSSREHSRFTPFLSLHAVIHLISWIWFVYKMRCQTKNQQIAKFKRELASILNALNAYRQKAAASESTHIFA